MMGIQTYAGSFVVPAAGTTTTPITGVPFAPQAFMFYGIGGGTVGGPEKALIGFDDGVTHVGAMFNGGDLVSTFHEPEQICSDTRSILKCIVTAADPNAPRLQGYISALTADGCVITWTQNIDSDHVTINFVAFAGVPLKVMRWRLSTATTQSLTGVGFQPTGCLSFFAGLSFPGTLVGIMTAPIGVGGGTPCGGPGQGSFTVFDRPTTYPTQNATLQIPGQAFLGTAGSGQIVSFDPDGLTAAFSTPDSAKWFGLLLLGGDTALNVVSFIGGSGTQSVPIPATSPRTAIMLSATKTPSGTSVPGAGWMVGVTDSGGRQGAAWTACGNNLAYPANPAHALTQSYGLQVNTPTGYGTSSVVAQATVTLAPSELRLAWGAASPGLEYLAIILADGGINYDDCGVQTSGPICATLTCISAITPGGSSCDEPFVRRAAPAPGVRGARPMRPRPRITGVSS
jgi:hypothetical protein